MPEDVTDPEPDLDAEAAEHVYMLAQKHKSGSGWFFWIAGLSLLNSAVILAGSDWSFLIGLGVTQIIDAIAMAIAEEVGAEGISIISVVAFVLDAVVAGIFVLWGVLARKDYVWAYIVGMVLYALDGLLFLLVSDWASFGFHVFALFCLYGGFRACRELNQLSAHVATVESTEDPGVY